MFTHPHPPPFSLPPATPPPALQDVLGLKLNRVTLAPDTSSLHPSPPLHGVLPETLTPLQPPSLLHTHPTHPHPQCLAVVLGLRLSRVMLHPSSISPSPPLHDMFPKG